MKLFRHFACLFARYSVFQLTRARALIVRHLFMKKGLALSGDAIARHKEKRRRAFFFFRRAVFGDERPNTDVYAATYMLVNM